MNTVLVIHVYLSHLTDAAYAEENSNGFSKTPRDPSSGLTKNPVEVTGTPHGSQGNTKPIPRTSVQGVVET